MEGEEVVAEAEVQGHRCEQWEGTEGQVCGPEEAASAGTLGQGKGNEGARELATWEE